MVLTASSAWCVLMNLQLLSTDHLVLRGKFKSVAVLLCGVLLQTTTQQQQQVRDDASMHQLQHRSNTHKRLLDAAIIPHDPCQRSITASCQAQITKCKQAIPRLSVGSFASQLVGPDWVDPGFAMSHSWL